MYSNPLPEKNNIIDTIRRKPMQKRLCRDMRLINTLKSNIMVNGIFLVLVLLYSVINLELALLH